MILFLFELFNSEGCFPEHWLVASSTVSLISCLDFRVTGEGVILDMYKRKLKKKKKKKTGSTTNNLKPYL